MDRPELSAITETLAVENTRLRSALEWMANESNWINADECEVKRTENSGAQRGIFSYSWGLKPWIFAKEVLTKGA